MAEIDLSKLGEQLKSFIQIEIEKVISERIALESTNIYHTLEYNLNSAIVNFTTSMNVYTDSVLHNTSINMRRNIERKLNQTLARRVRRFRTIMHSEIRSNLQNVKREIKSVLSESSNSSNVYKPECRKIRELSGKFKDLSKHLKDHKGRLFFTMFPMQLENSEDFIVQFIITAEKKTKVEILSEYAEINKTVFITKGVAYVKVPNLVLTIGTGRTFTTVLIRANHLISVVGFVLDSSECYSHCTSSSFIALPYSELGTDYSIITSPNNEQNCAIMATTANTTIIVEPASVIGLTIKGAFIKPGQKFKIVLNYLEGFHIQTHRSLSATKIYSNEPIVVISGNNYISMKSDLTCFHDCFYFTDSILYESMIPTDKWARHFVIPLFKKPYMLKLRLLSRNLNTTIRIKDFYNASRSSSMDSEEIEMNLDAKSYYVSASNPILLSLYALTEKRTIIMMVVPGIEHFSKEYVIAPPKDPSFTSYITITIKSSDVDGLRFVGNLLAVESSFIMVRNESYTSVVKKMAGHSVYKIRHVSRNALYGVVVYGFGSTSAYGYSAGFRF
ncbi:IgGFc-binding protein-like isoform X2 [Mytilus edulis]|uniref:IgGFc-binding protein-like isoform X2 n=1 Tax=Mytilus edulis TaxID=6550 RepID=UPI0039EFE9B1